MPDFISRHYYNTLSKATNVCACTIIEVSMRISSVETHACLRSSLAFHVSHSGRPCTVHVLAGLLPIIQLDV